MQIETKVEVVMSEEQKYMLWGIFHHHLQDDELDAEEAEFKRQLLSLLDPSLVYENSYKEKK